MNQERPNTPASRKEIHAVVKGNDGKSRWRRCGVAWPVNGHPGMFKLQFELIPADFANTDLLICDPKPRKGAGDDEE